MRACVTRSAQFGCRRWLPHPQNSASAKARARQFALERVRFIECFMPASGERRTAPTGSGTGTGWQTLTLTRRPGPWASRAWFARPAQQEKPTYTLYGSIIVRALIVWCVCVFSFGGNCVGGVLRGVRGERAEQRQQIFANYATKPANIENPPGFHSSMEPLLGKNQWY